MTTTCPNCGKPVRPGAKFCGNCGTTMPAAAPPRAAAAPAAPLAQAEAPVCPHCGKPVRAGARFCQACGKEITQPVTPPPPTVAPAAADMPLAPPPEPPAPSKVPQARPRRSGTVWIVITLVVLLVIFLGAAAGIYLLKPWELLFTPTAAPTLIPPSVTLPPPVEPSSTPVPPTETSLPPTSTPLPATPTQEATSPVISPTLTISMTPETPPVTPVLTATAAVTGSALTSALEDDFNSGDLNLNWLVWGSPLPKISGASDLALQLLGNAPRSSGVTSKERIVIQPGTSYQFDVRLEGMAPQNSVAMDWDPRENYLISSQKPGMLNLLIGDGVIRFKVLGEACDPVKIEGLDLTMHHIQIDVVLGLNFILSLDDAPICTISNISLPQNDGNVSFSGRGWIDNVDISTP